MSKTIYIPEEKISLLKEYFTRGEINTSGDNIFVFFRDKLFLFGGSFNLDEFCNTLTEGGYQNYANYFQERKSYDVEHLGRVAILMLSDVPRVLCGYISNNELHLEVNNYYDVINSPEYKKLMASNNFSKVYIESESGTREKLIYSADKSEETFADKCLPNSLYHGTVLRKAIGIVTKGLRPQLNQTNFKDVNHTSTVFLAKNITTACAYSSMFSPSALVKFEELPVVIEYDINRMDNSKFVIDYDVYNIHGAGEDKDYEGILNKMDTSKSDRIRANHENHTVDVVKDNPLKFNRVGYRGVVMPSAIKTIYVFYGTDSARMATPEWTFSDVQSFLNGLDEIKKFVAENDDLDEEKKVLPPYEKDEFEIGSEGGNNDYFHINESIDASEIGEVAYSWDFDEDEYKEWLEENEITNCDFILLDYIKDNVTFDLEYFDNEIRHSCGFDTVDYDGLIDLFGEKKVNEIINDCTENGGGRFETCELFNDDEFSVNNPVELNNAVMRQMRHGEYYKNARGFILTNGVCVYTDAEHNAITSIKGISDKFQFIKLGNIRVLPNSIDIGKQPTPEQRIVLRQIISCYSDDELYLDIFDEKRGEIGVKYTNPDWRRVLGEIDRYYSENIKPMGDSMYESKEMGNNTFASWFGKSVVVDKEGKPLKMYHGSGSEFEEFKKEFIGSNGAHEGYGFNFTPYRARAEAYNGHNVLEVYLRAEHPLLPTDNKLTPDILVRVLSEIDRGLDFNDTVVSAFEPPKYGEKWDANYYRRAVRVVAKNMYQYGLDSEYGDAGIYGDICLCGNGDKEKIISVFESLGYDSVIFYDDRNNLNTVVVFEPNQIKKVNNKTYNNNSNLMGENVEVELDADEVNLSSFKPNDTLADKLWDGYKLNPKARLRLLDIADDFWESTDISWAKPVGIILTGSICNFNWSKFSDIDLHLIVDFREIDERDDFVQEYFDGKKNTWNNEHKGLKIYGYPVEVYVENIDAETESGGIYDLENNKWLKKPNKGEIKAIGPDKYEIKNLVAKYCTKIDDLCDMADATDDKHILTSIGEKAKKLLNRIKSMRKFGLQRSGESDPYNIAYKCYRRMGYLDKLFNIKSDLYDRIKSIGLNESVGGAFDRLIMHFGLTSSIYRAGYVLPDGKMLDFSNGDPSNNRRGIDHRDVCKVDLQMSDVIKMGAIRIDAATGYITLMVKPTPAQICVIREIVRRNDGEVQVEIGDGDNSLSYVEYDGAKPSKVVADIIRYFDEGINLEANVNENVFKNKTIILNEKQLNVINEYLDKDYNGHLYKYFKWANGTNSEEKAIELAYKESYYLLEYLNKLVDNGKIDAPEDIDEVNSMGAETEEDENYIQRAIELMRKYKLFDHFVSWCYDNINCYFLPSWLFMEYIRPVKNEWCIHFGEDSNNIAREGFTGGTPDLDELAYTGAGRQKAQKGYDFAFLLGDKSVDFNEYGEEAVIFRTSGVLCYHYGDDQRQVVFWGPNAKEFIPIQYDRAECSWVVRGKKGHILKAADNPSEIAEWAMTNLQQYRKQIMAGKNGYIPKRFDYKLNKAVPYPLYRNESENKNGTVLSEMIINSVKTLKEEVNARGNSDHDIYRKRWHQERETLKNFLKNNGILMTSRENGKTYFVYYDSMLSNHIGVNYCVCVQYNMLTGVLGRQVYIRALDKFSQRMFRPTYDNRGMDNKPTVDDNSVYDEVVER